jgi:hypothetical protein
LYLTRKTACLGLLFIFLGAGFLFSEESPPSGETPSAEKYFFFEEFFLFGKPFSSEDPFFADESFSDEEAFLAEETPSGDEALLAEKSLPGDETLLAEETPSGDEALLAEGTPPGDETLLAEESLPGDEALLAEEFPPDDETLLAEELSFEDYLSEGGFFFEAPPLVFEVPHFVYELRSFDDIFPGFTRAQKMMAFHDGGLKHFFDKSGSPEMTPHPSSGIDLFGSVMSKSPSHIIEAMAVVPYNEKELEILDIYNALGKIGNIKDHTFFVNGKDTVILEETTRIENARSRRSIPDPQPVNTLPYSETMYLRFKDAYYGNLYIRGDVSMSLYGIIYNMTNFTDVRYFLIPIIKAERLSIIIYLEPIKEGVLIYSVSGLYLPGFIADRVNLTPSINRRITVLLKWIITSLGGKLEGIVEGRENQVLKEKEVKQIN